MKIPYPIRGWQLLFVIILMVTSACANQTPIPMVDPATEIPIVATSLDSGEKPVETATVPIPSATEIVLTVTPAPVFSTETPTPTTAATETVAPSVAPTMEASATSASSADGVWISNHDKRGSRTWIQFEVYSEDYQSKIDVLEACINYSCEYMGEIFVAEGCSGEKSPKGVLIKNGKFMIDFHGVMTEKLTHHSRLGMIYGQILENQVITGTWIIPVCDYWMPLDVRYTAETATP